MYGISLPFSWLAKGGDRFGADGAVPGQRGALFARLASYGARSVELRGVKCDSSPTRMLRVARELWQYGFQITVHGAVRSGETVMEDISRRLREDAEAALTRRVGQVEPTLVLITSVLLGVILLSVMLPLTHIMTAIG